MDFKTSRSILTRMPFPSETYFGKAQSRQRPSRGCDSPDPKTLNRTSIRKNIITVVLLRFNDLIKASVIIAKILHWHGLKRSMFPLSWTVRPKRRKLASFCPEPPQDGQSITDAFSLAFFYIKTYNK